MSEAAGVRFCMDAAYPGPGPSLIPLKDYQRHDEPWSMEVDSEN